MITQQQIEALAAIHNPKDTAEKFCRDCVKWDRIATHVSQGLGLHESEPKRILDLGCGFGYFANVCQQMGHMVTGLDWPGSKVIQAAAGILGVDLVLHTIRAFEPLPHMPHRFDLVTMSGVNLVLATDPLTYWGKIEYVNLVDTIRISYLAPGGLFVVRPNIAGPDSPTAELGTVEFWQCVAGSDATVSRFTNHTAEVRIQWP